VVEAVRLDQPAQETDVPRAVEAQRDVGRENGVPEKCSPAGHPRLRLVLLAPEPGSASEAAVRLLTSWGT
jgi:hypothetical protein